MTASNRDAMPLARTIRQVLADSDLGGSAADGFAAAEPNWPDVDAGPARAALDVALDAAAAAVTIAVADHDRAAIAESLHAIDAQVAANGAALDEARATIAETVESVESMLSGGLGGLLGGGGLGSMFGGGRAARNPLTLDEPVDED